MGELLERLGTWVCTLVAIAGAVAALAVFAVRAAQPPSTKGPPDRPVS
jgi:hypothetical protein